MANSQVVHVIDDDADVRQSLAFLLSTAGLAVRVHESAAAFLKILANAQDGCIVTDVRMPGMNGYQVTDAALRLKPELKVLLVTGYSQEPLPKHIADAGIKLLHKPLDMDQLSALAHKMLAHSRN